MRLGIPLVRQSYTWTCGPAALASVLYYWGVWDGAEPDLYAELGTTPARGTSPEALAVVARACGLKARVLRGVTVDDLRTGLVRRYTCILGIQAWGEGGGVPRRYTSRWNDGHYVVLDGIEGSAAYFADPSLPARYGILSLDELDERWHDVDDNGEVWVHGVVAIRGEAPAWRGPARIG